jgi:hypothetical protein
MSTGVDCWYEIEYCDGEYHIAVWSDVNRSECIDSFWSEKLYLCMEWLEGEYLSAKRIPGTFDFEYPC